MVQQQSPGPIERLEFSAEGRRLAARADSRQARRASVRRVVQVRRTPGHRSSDATACDRRRMVAAVRARRVRRVHPGPAVRRDQSANETDPAPRRRLDRSGARDLVSHAMDRVRREDAARARMARARRRFVRGALHPSVYDVTRQAEASVVFHARPGDSLQPLVDRTTSARPGARDRGLECHRYRRSRGGH